MFDLFAEKINETYKIILESIDYMFKHTCINNLKKSLGLNEDQLLSEYYCNNIHNTYKEKGVVYTPFEIAKYIVEKTIKEEEIIINPYIKILDPSCGCGNLLIPAFIHLREIYINNLDKINSCIKDKIDENEIDKHILNYNIFGYDIDEFAIKILVIDLFSLSGYVNIKNFVVDDFLLSELNNNFDIFIGNPPYVGHKTIDKKYSAVLKQKYKNIYKDKGDLSYCFFQNAINSLNKYGKLTFITSRYFLEAPSGEELRKVLKEICSIKRIIDFYGLRPFKNAGIDPLIIFISKEQSKNDEIEIIKPLFNKGKNKKQFYNSLFIKKDNNYKNFYINKCELNNKGWIIRDENERNIIKKIEEKSFTNLYNICDSYQGIITGCDKAFVVNSYAIEKEKLEQKLIKPWIKSSFIQKNSVRREDRYIIYSDMIDDENTYPNTIQHIAFEKVKLSKRRECVKGLRKWYQLQWGRTQKIFEEEKIVFPFKANSNRFSLDIGSYFSADVYCLKLKENVPFTYNYLLYLLNSKVYEFYFKTFAKKLGEDLYEYYPNNLMKLCIPVMMENDASEEFLFKYFGFTDDEIEIINKSSKIML